MASRTIAIRDAIVQFLDNYPFENDFIVVPSVLTEEDLADIVRTTLYVAPASIATGRDETRRGPGLEILIEFGLVQPLTANTVAEQDRLIELAEIIPLTLFGKRQAYAPMLTVDEEATRVFFNRDAVQSSVWIAEWSISYFDVWDKP